MYLTASSLTPWMMRRGLLDPADVVRGEFTVTQIDRHNRGFLIRRPATRPLFVKQLTTLDRFDIACLEREAHILRLAGSDERFASLGQAMPEFVDYDESRYALTVKLLPDARDLLSAAEHAGGIPLAVARQAGNLVAEFESECGRAIATALNPNLCDGRPPWILSYHRDQGDGWLSPANEQLLRTLQDDSRLTGTLDEIRLSWTADSLMHSDLKWDNVLAVNGEGAEENSESPCRFIDWEMVNRGDAAWDAATMVQCWWWYWIMSTPPVELTTLDDLQRKRMPAFDEHRDSLNAFWAGYVESLSVESAHERLAGCLRLAAARLLQTTYELLQSASEFSPQARLLVEMSRRFLLQPESAQRFAPEEPT